MIRSISSNIDTGNFFEEKEIAHPLWHGLKVIAISPEKDTIYNRIFSNRSYIPIGDHHYVPSSNKEFLGIWNAFRHSGKTMAAFQAAILKDPLIRKEIFLAAAMGLAEGEGFCNQELIVRKGWQDVAHQIAVIFPQTGRKIGEGGFGLVKAANGFIVDMDKECLEKTTFVLKEPKNEEALLLLERGMKLLKNMWGPGLVRPSSHLLIPNGRMGVLVEWAMPVYAADFDSWSQKNWEQPEKILRAFLTSFDGLELLQKNRVVHLDLKPPNLLVFEDKDHLFVDINDFDGCFALPRSLDAASLERFKEDLKDFSLLHTAHYCRKAETLSLWIELIRLKKMLNTQEDERDEKWLQNFSTKLEEASTLVSQIQIYEWGWSLVGALTGRSPTTSDKEPLEEVLVGLDGDLKAILAQTLSTEPAERPTLEQFKGSLVKYLKKSVPSYDHQHGTSHDPIQTRPLLGKSASRRAVTALPSRIS